MSAEKHFNDWTGYDPVLGNGSIGSLKVMNQHYGKGQISNRNTANLHIDETINIEEIHQVDQDEDILEEQKKIIYAHPSRLPYPPGTSASTSYSGDASVGYNGRHVTDSAVLIVDSNLEMRNVEGLDRVESLLVGDERDQELEGEYIRLQVNPFTV